VVVQGSNDAGAVVAGNNLPDFLPDYVIYDERTTGSRPRLLSGGNRPLLQGYFDRFWQVRPPERAAGAGTQLDGTEPLVSSLPIPPAPPLPPPPTAFLAPARDPAGHQARRIAERVPRFPNFRAQIPGATWTSDEAHVWSIRRERECLAALRRAGVPFRIPEETFETPIPTPVALRGPVHGVRFVSVHADREVVLACEMALRLPALVEILRPFGVRGVDVLSSYRTEPHASFHTMGLALDISRFRTDHGGLSVIRDFVVTPDAPTCEAPEPEDRQAREVLQIACALWRSRLFSSVLTPNYNEGHRDHFHLDARPDDPRVFLR
jgi:hypothetical protein